MELKLLDKLIAKLRAHHKATLEHLATLGPTSAYSRMNYEGRAQGLVEAIRTLELERKMLQSEEDDGTVYWT